MIRDGRFGSDTHAAADIWIPEMGGWIYQDQTFKRRRSSALVNRAGAFVSCNEVAL